MWLFGGSPPAPLTPPWPPSLFHGHGVTRFGLCQNSLSPPECIGKESFNLLHELKQRGEVWTPFPPPIYTHSRLNKQTETDLILRHVPCLLPTPPQHTNAKLCPHWTPEEKIVIDYGWIFFLD